MKAKKRLERATQLKCWLLTEYLISVKICSLNMSAIVIGAHAIQENRLAFIVTSF